MKLLIVDDDTLVRESIAEVVAQDFDSVFTAVDGEEAVVVAERELPDLVVLDLNMPRMSGVEACRLIREQRQGRPCAIVMLTATRKDEEVAAAFAAGADDYMVKPFSIGQLRARLRTHVLKLQTLSQA